MNIEKCKFYSEINHLNPKQWFTFIKYNFPEVFSQILVQTAWLPSNSKFTEKVYCYLYDIKHRPKCLNCSKRVSQFYGFNKGYSMYCSRKCVSMDTLTRYRKKETLNEHYGVSSPVKVRWNKK